MPGSSALALASAAQPSSRSALKDLLDRRSPPLDTLRGSEALRPPSRGTYSCGGLQHWADLAADLCTPTKFRALYLCGDMLEALPQLLSAVDPEIAEEVGETLRRHGVSPHTGHSDTCGHP